MNRLIILLLFFACTYAFKTVDITPIAELNPTSRWMVERSALSSEQITFKILLKQQNLDKLNKIFWEVSDPQHASYGKFMSSKDVQKLIAPSPVSVKRVIEWLVDAGVPADSMFLFSDYIHVSTSISKAEQLFSTSFSLYKSTITGNARVRIDRPAHIPTELLDDIDFVTGISELIENTRIAPKLKQRVAADNVITPINLKAYYGIPASQKASNKKNLQAVAAFSDYYSAGALGEFDRYFALTGINVTASGGDCLSGGCDQYESDLDVQYITAMGYGVPTLFLGHGDGEWILDWALQLVADDNAPLVNSISYGWAELDQCEVTSGCQTYGYNSQQYVTRTNTALQQLGTKGITVLVSDGDDGAPSLGGASGNCPMDNTKYCVTGGCKYRSSACTEITFTLNSNDTSCFFPMGIATDVCNGMLQDNNLDSAIGNWIQANSHCTIAFDSDYDKNPHVYSTCSCSQLQNYTGNGYTISAYTFEQYNGAVFAADYPTSSPYVTSVGATQFTWNGNSVASEIGASITTGAIITTGGGFSSFQEQASYQAAAVQSYIQSGVTLPPTFAFNPKMRAYPDISFNGHHYFIFVSNNTEDLDYCPCLTTAVDGTSCSAPALAGFISLINDQLLNAGKSPLGFLNTLLYQMATANPSAFHDITSGSNACNRAYCCQYGYQATKGWDPVSGLGSPVFSQFQKYALQAKGISN